MSELAGLGLRADFSHRRVMPAVPKIVSAKKGNPECTSKPFTN
jgi:hypothetical protein